MLKILSVVGARPQFIKASALSRVIREQYSNRIFEKILHTGQHYDDRMSDVFFKELGIPEPAYNLGVGSGSHGVQTGEMLQGIEEVLLIDKPDVVVVYGDTNSTLAGALAASKLHIPVAHIEAGLRSYNKGMPEEINRIVTDHVSTFLFTPTLMGLKNLVSEGFQRNASAPFNIDNPILVHNGDLMFDNAMHFGQLSRSATFADFDSGSYFLLTLHRESNTKPDTLKKMLEVLKEISANEKIKLVWPVHPRTLKVIKESGISTEGIIILDPVSYFEMLHLERNSFMIITDSGGVQKEAFFHQKKCLVLRNETEWVELQEHGTVEVAGTTPEKILKHYQLLKDRNIDSYPALYGDGRAAEICCNTILETLNT